MEPFQRAERDAPHVGNLQAVPGKQGSQLFGRQKLVPIMRTARNLARSLRSFNQQQFGNQCPVWRGKQQQAVFFHVSSKQGQKCVGILDMFDDLHAAYNIERAQRLIGQFARPIIDIQRRLRSMFSRDLNALLRCIDTRHFCAQPCQRFAKQSCAAPDIERRPASQRGKHAPFHIEVPVDCRSDELQSDRIKLVKHGG